MNLIFLKVIYFFNLSLILFVLLTNNEIKADQSVEIYADTLKTDNSDGEVLAEGNAIIFNYDGTKIKADKIIYNQLYDKAIGKGNVIINDIENNTYFLDSVESIKGISNVTGKNIKVRLNDGSRIVGSKITKSNNITVISDTEYTPCKEERYLIKNCPGWKLKSKNIIQDSEKKTVYYDHAKIYLFNVPIIDLPFFSHLDPSVNKRSGLLMPTLQTDKVLGDKFSIPFFINIADNKDLTFTPNFQSSANNFYSFNYRHLNKYGRLNIDGSIDDNDDGQGTKNHIFIDTVINNNYGKLKAFLKRSNNDTYLRKNKINKLTVLESGIDFQKNTQNTHLSVKGSSFKHLTVQGDNQWEYIYPRLTYNINNIKLNDFIGNFSSLNKLSFSENLEETKRTLVSSEINWNHNHIDRTSGLVYDNESYLRIVSLSEESKINEDDENIRFYPQISSKISFPLFAETKRSKQTLTPILMPILAPYNNYTDHKNVTNSNLFSPNRASSVTESESGPRINYGIDWFMEHSKNFEVKLTAGQSLKFNKKKNDTSNEISDFYLSSNVIFDNDKYLNNSVIIDRKNLDIKTNNANLHLIFDKFRLGIDYDYNSGRYFNASEQVRISSIYEFVNDLKLNFTGAKNIDTNKNIGYQYGLLYENDCIGIDLSYYRDMTQDRDIIESKGYSFTIVLKPFGTTKKYGKNRVFGPKI